MNFYKHDEGVLDLISVMAFLKEFQYVGKISKVPNYKPPLFPLQLWAVLFDEQVKSFS